MKKEEQTKDQIKARFLGKKEIVDALIGMGQINDHSFPLPNTSQSQLQYLSQEDQFPQFGFISGVDSLDIALFDKSRHYDEDAMSQINDIIANIPVGDYFHVRQGKIVHGKRPRDY